MSRFRFAPDWKGIWHYLRDPKTGWFPKIFSVLIIAYLLWPVDLLPDLVPFVGWLDDIGMVTIATVVLSRLAAKHPIPPPKEKE